MNRTTPSLASQRTTSSTYRYTPTHDRSCRSNVAKPPAPYPQPLALLGWNPSQYRKISPDPSRFACHNPRQDSDTHLSLPAALGLVSTPADEDTYTPCTAQPPVRMLSAGS